MVYRFNPDSDRYGGYNREEELELADIDPNRELRDDWPEDAEHRTLDEF